MEIYLIRHTQPDIAKGICYGQTDLELSDTFATELKAIKARLPKSSDTVYSSPLKRCLLLAKGLGIGEITFDERLMELDFGDWEMLPWEKIPQDMLNLWMEDYVHIAPPQGESMHQLQQRVLAWWQEVATSGQQKIAVITHAGVIRALLSYLQKIPLKEVFSAIKLEYGEVICYEYDG